MGQAARILVGYAVVVLLTTASGCAQWSQRLAEENPLEADTASPLPAMQISGDSITLEVAHIIVPEDGVEAYESIWREVDELAIDSEVRLALQENGFRLGRLGGSLPGPLRDLLQQRRDQLRSAEDGRTNLEDLKIHRIQMALQHDKELVVGGERPELNVFQLKEGVLRGSTLKDAECRFTLRAESEIDGSRLFLKPWIVHGPIKQSFSGKGGAWRISPERERVEFPELEFEVPLAPGETIILAPTEKLRAVGKLFFGEIPGKPRIMLIRLASSKANQLFDDGATDLAPISSLGE